MLHRLLDVGEWLVYYVILRGLVVHTLVSFIARYFKRTERQLAIWDHYKYRSQRMGHNPRSVTICPDGRCSLFR